MDWMYKGVSGVVDREDYLIGRKIDKSFELLDKEENPNFHKNDDDLFLANLQTTSINHQHSESLLSQSDIVSKMREDPLFEIKMKQLEQRKQILQNPLKLKKLKEMLMTSLEENKKKRHKNKRYRKKHHRSKKSKQSSKHSSASDKESESSDSEKISSDSNHSQKDKHRNLEHYSKESKDHRKVSNETESKKRTNKSNNDYFNKKKSSYTKPYSSDKSSAKKKTLLSEEEINKRRQEMIMNAEWREKTRQDQVKKLNEKDKLEEQLSRKSFQYDRKANSFIKPMLSNMAESNTIEDSVRQKRYKLQQGSNSMNVNFAKKFTD